MNHRQRYIEAHHTYTAGKSPAFFDMSGGKDMKVDVPDVRTSNGLGRYIVNVLKWLGGHGERINTMGIPETKTAPKMNLLSGQVENVVLGFKWRKSGNTTGSSDVHGHIKIPGQKFPVPIYIEVKIGRDTIKKAQTRYQDSVTSTGALHLICTCVEDFWEFYDKSLML